MLNNEDWLDPFLSGQCGIIGAEDVGPQSRLSIVVDSCNNRRGEQCSTSSSSFLGTTSSKMPIAFGATSNYPAELPSNVLTGNYEAGQNSSSGACSLRISLSHEADTARFVSQNHSNSLESTQTTQDGSPKGCMLDAIAEERWNAVLDRNVATVGSFWYGVRSTKICESLILWQRLQYLHCSEGGNQIVDRPAAPDDHDGRIFVSSIRMSKPKKLATELAVDVIQKIYLILLHVDRSTQSYKPQA